MTRRNISSGAPWEPVVGYSRAVRVGDAVHVSGTTATGRRRQGRREPATRTRRRSRRSGTSGLALEKAGATLDDVVRTRMYVTNIGDWEQIGRAHGEVFGEIRPASTMVEVRRLIDPAMLVEIEAEAIIEAGSDPRQGV